MPKKTTMDKILPLADAIKIHKNQYDSGDTDYSVTTLIQPPRIVHLQKRHLHKVETYVFDNLSSFIGTAVHDYFEKMLGKVDWASYICENRLFTTMLDRKISGAFDILKAFELYDIKTTSAWKVIKGDKSDWEAQQNMYRYLFKKNQGIELDNINIVAIFLDWTLYKMMQSGKQYPRQKVVQYTLKKWSYAATERYMHDRVQLMIDNENVADDDLPECTFRDYWGDPNTFAVKRKDRTKALRLLESRTEAVNWRDNYINFNSDKPGVNMNNLIIEPRLGRRKRCLDWCPVNVYCNQFHEYMKEVDSNENKSKSTNS